MRAIHAGRLDKVRPALVLTPATALLATLAVAGCGTDDPPSEGSVTSSSEPDREAEDVAIEAYYPRLADCLTERGFPATWDPVTGSMRVTTGPGPEADAGAEEADAACQEELGPKPTRAAMTEDELSQLYDLSLEKYDCLIEQGHEPAEPPTREKWAAEYRSGSAWDPFIDPNTGLLHPDDVCSQPTVGEVPTSAP